MAEQTLPDDFKEFLKVLNETEVRYLLVEGYAVGFHGDPRATADMGVWVDVSSDNAAKLVEVFLRFGMMDSQKTWKRLARAEIVGRLGCRPGR